MGAERRGDGSKSGAIAEAAVEPEDHFDFYGERRASSEWQRVSFTQRERAERRPTSAAENAEARASSCLRHTYRHATLASFSTRKQFPRSCAVNFSVVHLFLFCVSNQLRSRCKQYVSHKACREFATCIAERVLYPPPLYTKDPGARLSLVARQRSGSGCARGQA